MKRASIVSLFFAAALAGAALGPAGCGTGISDDLFAGSGDTAGNGTPSSSSGNAASSTSGSPAGGGGGDTTMSTSGSPSTTASSAGAGGAGGAGGDPSSSSSQAASSSAEAASSVAASSSSTGGGVVTLDCGDGLQCERGGQKACCWHDYETPEIGECVEGPLDGDNCSTGAQGRESRIECQIPEHCPMGSVCCGVRTSQNGSTWYSSVTCQAACMDIVLCDQLGEQGPDCPVVNTQNGMVQTVCVASTLLPPGFLVCGQP